jgi:hypothetical protein
MKFVLPIATHGHEPSTPKKNEKGTNLVRKNPLSWLCLLHVTTFRRKKTPPTKKKQCPRRQVAPVVCAAIVGRGAPGVRGLRRPRHRTAPVVCGTPVVRAAAPPPSPRRPSRRPRSSRSPRSPSSTPSRCPRCPCCPRRSCCHRLLLHVVPPAS